MDSIWNQLRFSLHNYLDFVIFIGFVELSNKNLEIMPKSVGKIRNSIILSRKNKKESKNA
ncbi:MAG: hypothetical protein BK997_03685 [Candidatus Micrarchaeum sp. ARMAN-1]|nr:MAG: hypothetical protein BK997_03685 [Candidatus Micrarchaeum sp. ARMAN-1]